MTYNVFAGMLNLTQSINQLLMWCLVLLPANSWLITLSKYVSILSCIATVVVIG